MQKLNFKIANSVCLNVEGKNFDLHNDFDFLGFNYALDSRRFVLNWEKSSGDWVAANLPVQLSLIFDNVAYLAISPRDRELPCSEDSCLAFFGYLRPEDKAIMDGFLPEEMSQKLLELCNSPQSQLTSKFL